MRGVRVSFRGSKLIWAKNDVEIRLAAETGVVNWVEYILSSSKKTI